MRSVGHYNFHCWDF